MATKNLARGGTVLLLGDSILDIHQGDQRVDAAMLRLFAATTPAASWFVINEARGGEYIGPREGDPKGVAGPLFTSETEGRYFEVAKKHRQVDVVVINYGGNDSKVYSPEGFRRRLETLCARVERDYPGAVVVLATGMYLDPRHSAGYWIDQPKVPGFKNGDSRNAYLASYMKEVVALANTRGYRVADTRRRIEEETKRGNWDLRLRAGDGDPKNDYKHANDMAWFDNIHPNPAGIEVIADVLVESLLKQQ